MILVSFVAQDAGLSWEFDGATAKKGARYELVGKAIRGEVVWYKALKGRYDVEALYKRDTERTKEADAAKSFAHVRGAATFAGMAAIQSDQTYVWNGVSVTSRCFYCAEGARAWVVRFWWPRGMVEGSAAADAAVKGFRRLKEPRS